MTCFQRALVLLMLFPSAVIGQQAANPDLAPGLGLLEEGRTTLVGKTLEGARNYFAGLTQRSPGNAAYAYELARVDYYRCNAADAAGDKKAAEADLEQAIAEAQQSLKLDDHSADARSLLADLYGRKIGLGRGFMLGARFGPKVDSENKRALELDGKNPRVLASLGRQYLHAPKMFGGDVEKAIVSLQRSTEMDPKADETFVWLAIAYRTKGDSVNANRALDEALRLNPQSAFARSVKAAK